MYVSEKKYILECPILEFKNDPISSQKSKRAKMSKLLKSQTPQTRGNPDKRKPWQDCTTVSEQGKIPGMANTKQPKDDHSQRTQNIEKS